MSEEAPLDRPLLQTQWIQLEDRGEEQRIANESEGDGESEQVTSDSSFRIPNFPSLRRMSSRRATIFIQEKVAIESAHSPASYSSRLEKYRPDWRENKCECPLYSFDQAAPWMKFNKYILTGYRSYYTTAECWLSWFRWHNETVNIWSHFLASVLFLGLMIYTLTSPDLLAGNYVFESWEDYAVQLLFLGGAFYCFFSSMLYHTLNAHRTVSVYLFGYTCDMIGISAMITGSTFAEIHYGLYCQRFWRYFYSIIVATLFAGGFILAVVPKFSENPKLILIRTFSFLGIALFSLIPTIHWLSVASSYEVVHFFIPLVAMWISSVIAFSFYYTFFPERKYPGKFDMFFSSHQWWHFFIFVGAIIWWSALRNFFIWRMQLGSSQCV